jgi:hypothetical protein
MAVANSEISGPLSVGAITGRQRVLAVRNVLLVLGCSYVVFVGRRKSSDVAGLPAVFAREQALLALHVGNSCVAEQKRGQ